MLAVHNFTSASKRRHHAPLHLRRCTRRSLGSGRFHPQRSNSRASNILPCRCTTTEVGQRRIRASAWPYSDEWLRCELHAKRKHKTTVVLSLSQLDRHASHRNVIPGPRRSRLVRRRIGSFASRCLSHKMTECGQRIHVLRPCCATRSLEHHDRWDLASRGEPTDARTHVHAKFMASDDLALCDIVSVSGEGLGQ